MICREKFASSRSIVILPVSFTASVTKPRQSHSQPRVTRKVKGRLDITVYRKPSHKQVYFKSHSRQRWLEHLRRKIVPAKKRLPLSSSAEKCPTYNIITRVCLQTKFKRTVRTRSICRRSRTFIFGYIPMYNLPFTSCIFYRLSLSQILLLGLQTKFNR